MGFVPPKKHFSWKPHTDSLRHVSNHLSYSSLKTNEEKSTPAFKQNYHGCLVTSDDLPANYFLYMLSETVINVILTTFVCCAGPKIPVPSTLSTLERESLPQIEI